MTLKKLFDDKYIGYHTFGLKINCKLKDLNIEHDYSQDYLTFEALEDGDIYFKYQEWSPIETQHYMEYSKDGGKTWVKTTNVDNEEVIMTIPLTAGEKVLVRGNNDTLASYNESEDVYYNSFFYSNIGFNVYGNIMSLIHGNDFIDKITVTDFMFCSLFYDSYGADYGPSLGECLIVNAENLILPATILANSCYYNMFCDCTNLTAVPELPATTLADYCYNGMFYGCTSLTTAPELPATTLANSCYLNMFYGCTSLTIAPELPATILATDCYHYMFKDCTSLTTVSELPATTLVESCYSSMFSHCTSLTTAPELPATTLASNCYSTMFGGCTSLTTAPELPATTLARGCYSGMFSGCTNLINAPELPATTLANSCYNYMFNNCISLIIAPELPATILASNCYSTMFEGCTSLTIAPELPAITLIDHCYDYMFQNCTSLNYIKAMFTVEPSTTYTKNWVNGVSSTGTFIRNSALASWITGVNGIPSGWTIQTADE